jgi:hypothetical protein
MIGEYSGFVNDPFEENATSHAVLRQPMTNPWRKIRCLIVQTGLDALS